MTTSTTPTQIAHPRAEQSLLWFEYLLFALVLPSFIGAAISWMKTRPYDRVDNRQDHPSSPEALELANHHEWLKRTFIAALLMGLISIGTANYGVGYFVAAGTAVWWIYRVLRGVAALGGGRPLPQLL